MKNNALIAGVWMSALSSGTLVANAEVRLHALFSDNMVLQRDKSVPVWGTAKAGEKVTVKIAKQKKQAIADANGNWKVRLDALKIATNLTLSAQGTNQGDNQEANTVTLRNVAVGDVYICAGQSNMEFSLATWSPADSPPARAAQKEIAQAHYPQIRFFTVPNATRPTPSREFGAPAEWKVCSPATAGGFSSVGYYFGRELHRELKIPIGLIDATWGGTIAEAWTSRHTLSAMPEYQGALLALDEAIADERTLDERTADWWAKNDAGSRDNAWAQLAFDDTSWKSMTLPTQWENAGLPGFDGVVWFRKTIEIPAHWNGDLTLSLGAIDDKDTTFWNGVQIGSTDGWDKKRIYTIPANVVKPGRNVVAVRVLDTGQGGGLYGNDSLRIEQANGKTLDLAGAWKYRESVTLSQMQSLPVSLENNPNVATVLYNGMISPLVPFGLRGAIWYQGESNTGAPTAYRTLFPALIRDWRTRFGQGDFGFYFVQLANFLPRNSQPEESNWAELREAQTMTLSVPNTGMATAIDIGEADDIHPLNKRDVGKRLALNALAKEYGRKIEYSGPMFKSVKREGSTLRVSFSHAAGLQTSDKRAPRGFALAGSDGKWMWATAKIVGKQIVLWNDQLARPTQVRYGWAHNPDVNLYNSANLPAVPFRTTLNPESSP